MRSPLALGVGRSGAAILALLAVLALGGGTALATSHLESEKAAEPKPGKIIAIKVRTDTILVGDQLRAAASRCDADGSGCRPARNARWKAKPSSIAKVAPKRGEMTLIAGKRAGTVTITATQGNATGSITLTINAPPVRDEAHPDGDGERLFLAPPEASVDLGQPFRVAAWGCRLDDGGRTGTNGVPDGLDDGCRPVRILEVNIDEGAPLTLLGIQDSTAAIRLDAFPGGPGDETSFVGVQIVTEIGSTLPSLLARNREYTDPLFYDVTRDGVVDAADRDLLSAVREPLVPDDPGFDPRLDLNADWRIDARDGQFFEMLAPGAEMLAPGVPPADEPTDGPAAADLDADGMVTRADYDAWVESTRDMSLPVSADGSAADVDQDGDITAADGDAIIEVLVRQVEQRLGGIALAGRLLGDVNADGVVNDRDQDSTLGTFYSGRYDAQLDFNADGKTDTQDWDALVDLIEAHGAEPYRGPAPTPTS